MLLRHLLDEGLPKAAIAQRLGVSRRLIYHWLATGKLDRELDAPASRTAARRPTKLDAYHGIIGERLAAWPELSAVRLFEEVRAAGYSGGITQLRDYVAGVRPRPEPEPVIRFETPPGRSILRPSRSRGANVMHCWSCSGTRASSGCSSIRGRPSRQ